MLLMHAGRLAHAKLIEADEDRPAGSCQLGVRFISVQSKTFVDLEPGAAFALDDRLQDSIWQFEGVVADASDTDTDWRVSGIEWQVWEVKERPDLR